MAGEVISQKPSCEIGGRREGGEGREGEWMIVIIVIFLLLILCPPRPPPPPLFLPPTTSQPRNQQTHKHTTRTYQLLLPSKGRLRASRPLAMHSGTGLVRRAHTALGPRPAGGTVTETIGLESGSQGLLGGGGTSKISRPRLMGLDCQEGQEGGEEDEGGRVEKAGHAFSWFSRRVKDCGRGGRGEWLGVRTLV